MSCCVQNVIIEYRRMKKKEQEQKTIYLICLENSCAAVNDFQITDHAFNEIFSDFDLTTNDFQCFDLPTNVNDSRSLKNDPPQSNETILPSTIRNSHITQIPPHVDDAHASHVSIYSSESYRTQPIYVKSNTPPLSIHSCESTPPPNYPEVVECKSNGNTFNIKSFIFSCDCFLLFFFLLQSVRFLSASASRNSSTQICQAKQYNMSTTNPSSTVIQQPEPISVTLDQFQAVNRHVISLLFINLKYIALVIGQFSQ
jgi:hypothetical protein